MFNDFNVCGKSNRRTLAEILNRIVGGTNAEKGDLPWQAALRSPGDRLPFCGATLISKKWAVTAAHCDIKAGTQVVLGANNLGQLVEGK